jgi:hypothetical protein
VPGPSTILELVFFIKVQQWVIDMRSVCVFDVDVDIVNFPPSSASSVSPRS